jgi:YidC/Oxa1 family membrane protein insertase
MNPIFEIYNLIFYQPVSQTLFFFYKYLKDLGLAVIFLTILVRLILLPLNYKSAKEQEKFLKIKKGLDEIEKKFDGERKAQEILNLYRKEKVNPLFNLIFLFIQFPILVALYQVFLKATSQVNPFLFGVLNLSESNFLLVMIAVAFQIFYLKLTSLKGGKEKAIYSFPQTQMNLFFVPFTFLILLKLPSAISLYFIISYLFSILEKKLIHV